MKTYRQGDVLLIATQDLDESGLTEVPREDGLIVLAHGEATGHRHAIDPCAAGEVPVAVLFQRADQVDRVLRARLPVRLYHDEHADVELPAGDYVVRRQREYSPAGLRQVVD